MERRHSVDVAHIRFVGTASAEARKDRGVWSRGGRTKLGVVPFYRLIPLGPMPTPSARERWPFFGRCDAQILSACPSRRVHAAEGRPAAAAAAAAAAAGAGPFTFS
eukprot:COSAG02_NODE_929_length_15840_cov_55.918493_4_plen_106_part_00